MDGWMRVTTSSRVASTLFSREHLTNVGKSFTSYVLLLDLQIV